MEGKVVLSFNTEKCKADVVKLLVKISPVGVSSVSTFGRSVHFQDGGLFFTIS